MTPPALPRPASQRQAPLIISISIFPNGHFQSLYNKCIALFLDLLSSDIIY